jgi:hypothetical protein
MLTRIHMDNSLPIDRDGLKNVFLNVHCPPDAPYPIEAIEKYASELGPAVLAKYEELRTVLCPQWDLLVTRWRKSYNPAKRQDLLTQIWSDMPKCYRPDSFFGVEPVTVMNSVLPVANMLPCLNVKDLEDKNALPNLFY